VTTISKTNKHRADRGLKLLEHHQTKLLSDVFDEDYETGVASLLTDIRHFCHQNDIDFHAACDLSYKHYLEELNGCDDYLDEEEEQ